MQTSGVKKQGESMKFISPQYRTTDYYAGWQLSYYRMTLIIWIKSYLSLSSRIIVISGVFILIYRSGRIGHILAESDTRFYR